MDTRKQLKELYAERAEVDSSIQAMTHNYLLDLKGARGIFITDHAIVRYLERVKGIVFNDIFEDTEKLKHKGFKPDIVREEMLSLDEDREILKKRSSFYNKGSYGYIVKELSIITVLDVIN